MPVEFFSGLRSTSDFGTDERPKSFRESILMLQPNGHSPINALLSQIGSESLNDPEFSWWDEELKPIRVKLNADITNVATAVTLLGVNVVGDGTFGNGNALQIGDTLMVDAAPVNGVPFTTTERMRVTAINSATSITVTRGYGGSTAAAYTAASNVFFTRIGSTFAEGSGSPASSSRNPAKYSNYAQIFKTIYSLTNTTNSTKFRTGDPLKNDKMRKMFDHSASMEFALLFGRKSEIVGSNGEPERMTGGIHQFLSASNMQVYANAAQATVNEGVLLDFYENMFVQSSPLLTNERLAFCGGQFLSALNKVILNSASTRIEYDGEITLFGLKFKKFSTPTGSIAFRIHPQLNNHPLYSKSCFYIAPRALRWRDLRKTTTKENIQLPDEDQLKGMWISECGLEVLHPSSLAFQHFTATTT